MLFNDYVDSLEKLGIFGDVAYKKAELRKTSVFKVSRQFMEKEIDGVKLTPEQEELVHDGIQFLLPCENMWIDTTLKPDESDDSNLSDEERRHGILIQSTKDAEGKRAGILIHSILGVRLRKSPDYFSSWGAYVQICDGKFGCFYVIQKNQDVHKKLVSVLGPKLKEGETVGDLYNKCVPFYAGLKEMIAVPIMAVRDLTHERPDNQFFRSEAELSWSMFSKVFNIIMGILYWINCPKTYIIREIDHNQAKLETIDRKKGVIRKRNFFTVLSHEQVRTINPAYNLHTQTRMPHARRGHWRRITGRKHEDRWIEFSKEGCINGRKWIDEMWVGPKSWEYRGKQYVLVSKRGVEYKNTE